MTERAAVTARSRRLRTERSHSFTAVGIGIGGVGQTTFESAALIRSADKVFYCVIDTAVELWLRELNPSAESLTPLYEEGKDRSITYAQMVEAFVGSMRSGKSTCAVYYGHPGVFVEATHRAIRRLRREGYAARMVPAVSADGCLFADLLVNPGDHGMQSYEASDFLVSRRRIDARTGLLLWQVGVLGERDWTAKPRRHPERIAQLTDRLRRQYPDDHQVVLYFASTFPCDPPMVRRFALRDLPRRRVYPMELLYVPPSVSAERSPRRARAVPPSPEP
jgi:uncharacterized protein YabN with tetrapyrrole methylase and pyrophosphatase domain